jgi:hypothetical protein
MSRSPGRYGERCRYCRPWFETVPISVVEPRKAAQFGTSQLPCTGTGWMRNVRNIAVQSLLGDVLRKVAEDGKVAFEMRGGRRNGSVYRENEEL